MEILNPTRNIIDDLNSLNAKDSNDVFINPEDYLTKINWSSTNSTLSVVSEKYVHPLQYSLKIEPTNPSTEIKLSLTGIVPSDIDINGSKAQFHCQIFPQREIIVNAKLTNVTESTSNSHSQQLTIERWNGVFSPVIDVEFQRTLITGATKVGNNVTYTASNSFSVGDLVQVDGVNPSGLNSTLRPVTARTSTTFTVEDKNANGSYSSGGSVSSPKMIEFDVELTITNHFGQYFYVSVPTLMNELGFTKNTFVYNMRKFIPSFIWDKDKIQEYPNYPFAKLLHAMTEVANKSTVFYSRFYNYLNNEISTKNETAAFRHSQLVDPNYVHPDYINWLSQFNGTQIYKSIRASNGAEAISDVEDSVDWQLVHGHFGRNAGTVDAIKEAAKQVLTGTKSVIVSPGGSFFQINIYTNLSETPGVTSAGDTSPQVLALVEKTKPMGFAINHQALTSLTLAFILDDPNYGILSGPGILNGGILQ